MSSENLDSVFEVLVELIQALMKLSKNKDEEISLASIEFVQKALNYLVEKVNKNSLEISQTEVDDKDSFSEPRIETLTAYQIGEYKKILESK